MTFSEIDNWAEFVETHRGRVFRIALRILGSVQDAEDVTQEVFIAAFEKTDKHVVRSWGGLLVRIVMNRAFDRLRKRVEMLTLESIEIPGSDDPIEGLIAREFEDALHGLVRDLPDQQATIFSMRVFESMSVQEVADALGISCNAVSVAMLKARKALLESIISLADVSSPTGVQHRGVTHVPTGDKSFGTVPSDSGHKPDLPLHQGSTPTAPSRRSELLIALVMGIVLGAAVFALSSYLRS